MLSARLIETSSKFDPACVAEEEAARWIRIDTGNLPDVETARELVQSAMTWIETRCKQPIFSRDYYGMGASFCNDYLPSLNVTAVAKVEYQLQGSADWLTLDQSKYTWWESGELFFTNAARQIQNVSRIKVWYTAGYESEGVPADLKQVVRLLVAKWFDSRSDEKKEVPSLAEWLTDPYILPIVS